MVLSADASILPREYNSLSLSLSLHHTLAWGSLSIWPCVVWGGALSTQLRQRYQQGNMSTRVLSLTLHARISRHFFFCFFWRWNLEFTVKVIASIFVKWNYFQVWKVGRSMAGAEGMGSWSRFVGDQKWDSIIWDKSASDQTPELSINNWVKFFLEKTQDRLLLLWSFPGKLQETVLYSFLKTRKSFIEKTRNRSRKDKKQSMSSRKVAWNSAASRKDTTLGT